MAITALYAALITSLFLALSVRVIMLRGAARIALGDGGDRKLSRAIRAHANCAEYAPIGILLVGLAESLSAPGLLLHALGIGLLAGRVVHAYGVSQEPENTRFRATGMGLTFTAIGVAAGAGLIAAVIHGLFVSGAGAPLPGVLGDRAPRFQLGVHRRQGLDRQIADREHADHPRTLDHRQMPIAELVHPPDRLLDPIVRADRVRLRGHDLGEEGQIRIQPLARTPARPRRAR